MMRVALLLEELSGGGVERTTLKLARGFLDRGLAVDLLLARAGGPLANEVPEGVRVVLLEGSGAFSARLAIAQADPGGLSLLARPLLLARHKRPDRIESRLASLADYLLCKKPEVFLSAKFRPNLFAVLARSLASAPTRLILTERTSPTQHSPGSDHSWRRRSAAALMRRYYPRADRIVTVSHDLADALARFAGLKHEQILTIYNPVVDEQLEAAAREKPDHPWLVPNEPPVVLSVGRLEVRKDFPTLLRAFALVRRTRPIRLIILGEGKTAEKTAIHKQELEILARDLGVAEDVSLPGFEPNPYAYMARAAAFVLSSHYEGLPGVLIQALACGCPAISTDCPTGPREILEGGRYGPLVPVGDHARMADAIVRVLDIPPPRDALRARAQEFTVASAVDAYLALFRDVSALSIETRRAPSDIAQPDRLVSKV